ncbi:hypothetical protein GGP53_002823 [Salinibacter ruber]|uniref:sulfotransferase domain-containing protein n=1 Tax=Salinibacter ruber TaxID=146919 RepID=UPI002168F807|nr:sulfotransferase domain-containing protein [Salinibacter ruber]MCS3628944.1 hypothetical protein [Salinibacter ruber]MCS4145853.1 hypothetical protein [Salinibacter ruber]
MDNKIKSWGRRRVIDLTAPENCSGTIVVVGSGRSGTTWLAELLRTLDGYKYLHEPLNLDFHSEARRAGFDWRTYIGPDEHAPWAEDYLEGALTGHLYEPQAWYLQSKTYLGKFYEHYHSQNLVVKFCRAHRLIHWLRNRFDVQGVVFIVRHPCAVIASMNDHGGWNHVLNRESDPSELFRQSLSGDVPDTVCRDVRNRAGEITSPLKAEVVTWCVDHYVPFHVQTESDFQWVLTSYERLLTQGVEELERVVEGIGKQVTPSMRASFDSASRVASKDLTTDSVHKQLTKCRQKLSRAQIDTILETVEAFDLDFYTEEPFPDYKLTAGYQ